MSKPFSLETDDRTDEERAKANAASKGKCHSEGKRPMDSNYQANYNTPSQVRFDWGFNKKIQGLPQDPDEKRFSIKRLFDAVSSGDVSQLEDLQVYLRTRNKKLTDSTYKDNGKTALTKALLNLKDGENKMVEYLLDIAESLEPPYAEELVNTAYTDSYYKGQTALHIAIERRSKRYAELLLQKKANVHAMACGSFFQPTGETCFYFGELPLSLAACTNQKEMVELLMDNSYQKADATRQDSQGNTVLHALVMVADNSPENTEFVTSMYDYILTKHTHLNTNQKLEYIQNNRGCTPIKLAAKTGKIGLFEHILHREFQQEECRHLSRKFTEWAYGPVYASLYDLSSLDTYEKNSVLEIIVYGTEIPNRLEMLEIEPLNKLLEDKWNRFAHRMFFFNFICYLIYLSVFTVTCCFHEELKFFKKKTQHYLHLTGEIITTLSSVYFFIKGVMDLKRKPPRLQTLLIDGYSDLLFLFQAVCFLLCAGLYLGRREEYLGFLVICLALSWINLLYFSRGSQTMGIYSVMIQRMILGDILRFLFVYFAFLIGFSAAVMTLLRETDKGNSSYGRSLFEDNSDSDSSCAKVTYKNISFTTLELFKFTIGMGDLEFTADYHNKHIFYMLLISYIVLTYILLLNMLIALMSRTVERMSKESTSIWKLQRAITILDLERTLCQCLKTKLRSGVEKDLGKKEPDLRCCLRVEEVNWNKWNHNLGIINEDPGDSSRPPSSSTRPQRDQRWHGFLRDFSQRRPNTSVDQEEQEMRPLASTSV